MSEQITNVEAIAAPQESVFIPPPVEQTEEIAELAKAMAKFQGEVTMAKKDGTNPFFNSNYATLPKVLEAVLKNASKNGLSHTQGTYKNGQTFYVWTQIMHISGQWIRFYTPLPIAKPDVHGVGSAITYGRRYALASAFGISQEDDDGNEATKPKSNKPRKAA